MPTYNRARFVRQAIHYFQRQDYQNKELIVLDDGSESVAHLMPEDPQIRYFRSERRATISEKLNLGCQLAQGEIFLNWDDDDWMADWRIKYQVETLLREQTDICGLSHGFYYQPETNRAWRFVYPPGLRLWLQGGTFCYWKSFWREHPYPNIATGGQTLNSYGTAAVGRSPSCRIQLSTSPSFTRTIPARNKPSLIGINHNLWNKSVGFLATQLNFTIVFIE